MLKNIKNPDHGEGSAAHRARGLVTLANILENKKA